MTGMKGISFPELEKFTLIDLIGSRKDIIENKNNGAQMIMKKYSESEKNTGDFNSRHGIYKRATAQLIFLWKI